MRRDWLVGGVLDTGGPGAKIFFDRLGPDFPCRRPEVATFSGVGLSCGGKSGFVPESHP